MAPPATQFPKEIDAFVLHGAHDARHEKVPMPPMPGPDEVLVRSLSVGICGSDIHYMTEGHCGIFVVEPGKPMILGHETCGVIAAVGSEVTNVKVGDRVAVEPAMSCDKCHYCRGGQYNLCPNVVCHATPPYLYGSLATYFLHRANYVFKVPDHLSNDEVAMVEPLAVAVHACKRVRVTVGDKVLVTGAGPIGIFAALASRAYGATRVVITDINEGRLKLAKELGVDETILVTRDLKEADLVERVKQAFGGAQPDISMECSAAPSCTRLVMLATRSGGTCIQVGMGPQEILLPISDAAIREVTILGAFRYNNCFPPAIDLVASGRLNLKPLATHHYDFKDAAQAYETARLGAGMKVIIKVAD